MAEKQVIAIDCDDVLIDATEYIVHTYNQRFGTNVSLETAHASDNNDWLAPREEVFQRFNTIQSEESFGMIAPRADALEVVPRLAKQFRLHLVTARPDSITAVTQRMLDQFFPDCFVGISHVGPDNSKGEVCANIGAFALVDDNIRHLATASEHGVEQLVWFGGHPWQIEQVEAAQTLPIIKCGDWYAIEQAIGAT